MLPEMRKAAKLAPYDLNDAIPRAVIIKISTETDLGAGVWFELKIGGSKRLCASLRGAKKRLVLFSDFTQESVERAMIFANRAPECRFSISINNTHVFGSI